MTDPNINPDGEREEEKIREYLTNKGYELREFPERLDWMATRVEKTSLH